MWDSIWQALLDAGITIPEDVKEVTISTPSGQEFTVEVPEENKGP
jgi:hypothetical protein